MRFFVLHTLLLCAGAEIFSLNDRSYPHIFINDPAVTPVIWHKKGFGFRLANAAAVRINARCALFAGTCAPRYDEKQL
jgi:hypothetical protein